MQAWQTPKQTSCRHCAQHISEAQVYHHTHTVIHAHRLLEALHEVTQLETVQPDMQSAVAMVQCLFKLISRLMRVHEHVRDAQLETSGKRPKSIRCPWQMLQLIADTAHLLQLILSEAITGICTIVLSVHVWSAVCMMTSHLSTAAKT